MRDASQGTGATDGELVRRAREGDHVAMDALVGRHHASVYRVAVGILRDEDRAADVAQDSFLKAFGGLKGFREEASFRTWLLTIAANQARGILRTVGRRREESLETAGPLAHGGESPEDAVTRKEEVSRMREMLERLPEKQRQAVTLRIFEGLGFRDVGRLIGSSEGAARVNFHHGIRRLREMME